jgi:hypothetical protein
VRAGRPRRDADAIRVLAAHLRRRLRQS